MENRFSRLGAPGLIAALAALLLALCAIALPATAMADEAAAVAHSGEGDQRVDYTSIGDAMNASYTGATIVMDTDWDMGKESLDIPSGKTCTIDLNGHRITGSGVIAICMMNNSNLKLMSSAPYTDFSYRGYAKTDGDLTDQTWGWRDLTVNAGGLVTNTAAKSGQGISVSDACKLEIENLAVAGCSWNGIVINGSSTVDLTNTTVCHNTAGHSTDSSFGGGVAFASYRVTLNMTNSHIDDNYAINGAGGVLVSSESTLNMEKGSTISRNAAGDGGGGILCESGAFTIKSQDGTGTIEGNASLRESAAAFNTNKSGGGIHVNSTKGTNSGLIEGVTIKGNYAGYDGGGVELDQRGTRLVNCKIIGNSARLDGGGVFVYNDDNSIEGCEIRDNWCGGGYEGGGVFVSYHYDVKMSGTCVVKGNTRGEGSGNADDVFLSTLSGGGGKAYITGTLAQGSSVGVRTGVTGDRRIAKDFKPETKDCLFYDLSGYYVSYGNDEGGDAWQRHTAIEFTVKLDGQVYGKYRNGSAVALAVPQTKGGKVFWRWDTEHATGLNPLGDYFTEKGVFSNALSFSMPQNDVSLAPIYIDHVTAVRFQVEAPEAGRALATTGKLWRSDGGASLTQTVACSVYWYEVDKDGNVSDTAAAGLAKANTAYKAYLVAPEVGDQGFFYDDEVSVAVSLVSASGDLVREPKVTKTYLTLSNDLAAHVDDAYTTGPGSGDVKTGTVKVQLKNKGLAGNGEAAVAALSLDGEADAQADDTGVADTAEISYAYNEDADTVTIAAPAREGYNFCNWDGVPSGIEADDEAGTVTASASQLESIESLTAVYTPVATALDVKLDAPVAATELSATCADVVATCSDGKTVSLAEGFGVESFDVTWSPETEDGKAGFSTSYTALIKLCDGDGFEDVEKALAAAAKVTCNGAEATAAGFTVVDGELCLAVSFPATRDAKVTSVSAPADVELTFEQAKACAELGTWPLQKSVDLEVESGVAAEGDVAWEAVEGFDANATGAQVLAAKGKVTSVAAADGSEVDTDGASLEVTATVKVAAPAKQASDDTDATTTTTASKKGTPSTGDVTWGGFAGLLAVAVVCLVAARVSRRER